MPSKLVKIGTIVNTHGLNGELRVLSNSDFKDERFKKGAKFTVLDQKQTPVAVVELSKYRQHKTFDLLTFKGLNHINDVEKYKGYTLAIDVEQLRDLAEDEGYYYQDIIGCAVFNGEEHIGKVYKIAEQPGQDLWYVKQLGRNDIIIPFTDAFVKNIDIEKKVIQVNLIKGMILDAD